MTVLGIAARNGIMLVSHYRHLETEEGEPFGLSSVIRGSEERLAPILMTALSTGLAMLPLVIEGDKPGQEIEHPLAIVILGGLVTSTVLNLFLLPALYAAFAKSPRERRELAQSPDRQPSLRACDPRLRKSEHPNICNQWRKCGPAALGCPTFRVPRID